MNDAFSKHDHVLMALVVNLQTMAMVQLGKVASPHSGEVERDLDAARATIDILEMLKVKCRDASPQALVKLLDQAVMDLQMNYLDEVKRDRREAAPATDAPAAEDATP
ncbi:MAG: DUF1844 domain-containing protein [Candidatus Krumholzibacteriia bacterium]